MEINNQGSITVFLTLILVLIVALISTTVEATRINLAKIQVERALNTAMTSVLAEYDTELMNKYGIIAFDAGYGGREISEKELIKRLEYYTEQSLIPTKYSNSDNIIYQLFYTNNEKSLDLYQFDIDKIEIVEEGMSSLLGQNGEIIKHQILEYMKYRGPLLLFEEVLDKFKILEQAIKTTEVVENKSEVDEKSGEVGKLYLELMTLLDGVEFDKQNYPVQMDGQLKLKEPFVKQITFDGDLSEVTIENYNAIVAEAIQSVDLIYLDTELINQKIEEAIMYNKDVYIMKHKITEQKEEGIDITDEESENVYSQIERMRLLSEECITDIQSNIDDYYKNLLELLTVNKEAIKITEKIIKEADKLEVEITNLEAQLQENKDEIDELTHLCISQELDKLREDYGLISDSDESNGKMHKLASILQNNIDVLDKNEINNLRRYTNKSFVNALHNASIYLAEEEIGESVGELKATSYLVEDYNNFTQIVLEDINSINNSFSSYSVENMLLNYDHFTLDNEKISDPRDNTKAKNIKSNLNEIGGNLQSNISIADIEGLVNKLPPESIQEVNTMSFDKRDDVSSFLEIIKEFTMDSIADKYEDILVNEYILANFNCATDHIDDSQKVTLSNYSKEDNYLNYEVEYILKGNDEDQSNLNAVKNQILFIRIALNIIHVYSDSTKRTITSSMATSIAGFLPLLIPVIQFCLTALWATVESYADLDLLLKGEKVAFIKNKNDWITMNLTSVAVDFVAENLADGVESIVDKSVSKAEDVVSSNLYQLDTELQKIATEEFSDIFEKIYDKKEQSIGYINYEKDKIVGICVESLRYSGEIPHIDSVIPIGNEGENLAEKIVQIVEAKSESIIESTDEELKTILDNIDRDLQSSMNEAERYLNQQSNNMINEAIKEIEEFSTQELKAITVQGEDYVKNTIYNFADSLKNKMSLSMDDVLSKSIDIDEMNSSFIKFSYKDYLRLFLLISKEENNLKRAMTCIQLNLMKSRDKNINIENYLYSFTGSITVEMEYIFLRIGWLPDFVKNIGKNNKYKIEIPLEMSY